MDDVFRYQKRIYLAQTLLDRGYFSAFSFLKLRLRIYSFVIGFQFCTKIQGGNMSHQLSLSLQPLMELIISSPAHIPHSKMESQKGSIDTYQRNGSCSDVWQPCPPLSSKISGPMLVGGLFHRGLYHQPPSSVLGDITPYQCLFGSPPDYENIRLFFCYAYIPAQLRQKLAPRANRCFLKGHASAHVFTKRIKPLRAFSSWKDQTNQEIGSDEGERELLLKERESLLLTPHE